MVPVLKLLPMLMPVLVLVLVLVPGVPLTPDTHA